MNPGYHPILLQINTRIWLQELGQARGRPATLADVPDDALDRSADLGFDWIWLLGVWQTGPEGLAVSRAHPEWDREFRESLADFRVDDVCGSPFAVQKYSVHADFGGDDTLVALRRRLSERGLRLMLDFVPNHTAMDHVWVYDRPEFYIQGDAADLAREPQNYRLIETRHGPLVLAYGRDPYFPGWPDTFQLNYRHLHLREAMMEEMLTIARCCDGVRCDMAMLLLPAVIERAWGDRSRPRDGNAPVDASFWPDAIGRVHEHHADFMFMAEVYWDLEWTLQQQGFAYTYDKHLYDRLHRQDAAGARAHLGADIDFQRKSVHFLENHDEPRAAGAFPPQVLQAAAVVTYLAPGMRFFHEGQLEGRRRKAPLHLSRRPVESVDVACQSFFCLLLDCLKRPEVRGGRWRLLDCRTAWDGNPTWERFLAFSWESGSSEDRRLLVTVNYGSTQGQCYVLLPFPELPGKSILLRDLLSSAEYERAGDDLASKGFYLDVPAWGHHVFEWSEIGVRS
jgi:hypothetical protein